MGRLPVAALHRAVPQALNVRATPFADALRNSFLTKIILGLLVSSALAIVVGFVVGLTGDELRGQISFGLLVGCLLVASAVGLAMRTAASVFWIVRCSWLLMAMLVLLVAFGFGADGGDTVLIYGMAALAFPASVPIAPLVGFMLGEVTQQMAGLLILWLLMFATGYVQWFVVCPRLFRGEDKAD